MSTAEDAYLLSMKQLVGLKFSPPIFLLNTMRANIRDFMNDDKTKSKTSEKSDKITVTEKERHKGKVDKAQNKARAAAGKARAKKAGHEAVSDQKSHEYH